jgi:hypothetical protein
MLYCISLTCSHVKLNNTPFYSNSRLSAIAPCFHIEADMHTSEYIQEFKIEPCMRVSRWKSEIEGSRYGHRPATAMAHPTEPPLILKPGRADSAGVLGARRLFVSSPHLRMPLFHLPPQLYLPVTSSTWSASTPYPPAG